MKKLLFLVMVVFVTSVSFSQFGQDFIRRQTFNGRTLTAGTAMAAKAYTAATDDTTQAIDTYNWVSTVGVIAVKDSASMKVYYQPSYDGINFDASILIDSLSNNVNAGATMAFPLPKGADNMVKVRFEVVGTAYRLGTSSATYSFKVVQKRY